MADHDAAGEANSVVVDAFWRQCSLCMPSDPAILPSSLAFDSSKDMLLVATQTCPLVGKGAEPTFEVAAVSIVERFDPEAPEAKGKITRFLQLPLDGTPEGRGIRLDISRRAMLPSELLQGMQSVQPQVSDGALRTFQGWIARYYGRIALPDALDGRLRKRQFHKKVENALNETLQDNMIPYKVHTDIDRVYIRWSPDRELPSHEDYMVKVLFVCKRPDARNHLLERLSGLATGVKGAPRLNGLLMDDPSVVIASELTIEQISNMSRFTAFDEFSALGEVARAMGGD